jgi:RNA polymerase-binding protein DksA
MRTRERKTVERTLRAQREAIFRQIADTELDLGFIAEDRESELEERAQEERTARVLARLDDRGKREIEAIDAALQRISEGTYGACEACRKPIPAPRLRALPATTFCVDCARGQEAASRSLAREEEERISRHPGRIPAVAGLLTDQELEESLREQVRGNGSVEMDELRIVCRHGVAYLDGALPSEGEHQILLALVEDVTGIEDVVDRLQIEELPWQREERGATQSATTRPPGTEPSAGTGDVVESIEEGIDFEPATGPTPQEE